MSDGGLTFRLLGQGIAYSASPAMMTAAFAELGLPHRYVLEDVAPDDVATAVDAAPRRRRGWRERDRPPQGRGRRARRRAVRRRGARRARSTSSPATAGACSGYNTDLPAHGRGDPDDSHRRASGTPSCSGPEAPDARPSWLSRDSGGRARHDAAPLRREHRSACPRRCRRADLLVNATPSGPARTRARSTPALLRPDLAVLDLVYRPEPDAPRARRARGRGDRGGRGGHPPGPGVAEPRAVARACPAPVEAMRRALRAELGEGADA